MIKQLLEGVVGQNEVFNYYNAALIYKELPYEVYGFVFYYRGIYCIIINKLLSYCKKKKTILHELAHIELNQLCQANKDMFEFYIDKYEDEANEYIKKILNDLRK